MLLFLLLHINCCNRKKCNRCFRCLVHTVEFGTVLPDQLGYSLPYGILQSSKLVICYSYFCGGLLATLAQHANQLATPALSQFIFTLSRTTFAGQHMAKGSLDVCRRVFVCVSLAQSRCCQFPFHILSAAAALTASYFLRN